MNSSGHLTEKDLALFSEGKSEGTDLEKISNHLARCRYCSSALQDLFLDLKLYENGFFRSVPGISVRIRKKGFCLLSFPAGIFPEMILSPLVRNREDQTLQGFKSVFFCPGGPGRWEMHQRTDRTWDLSVGLQNKDHHPVVLRLYRKKIEQGLYSFPDGHGRADFTGLQKGKYILSLNGQEVMEWTVKS